MAPITLEIVIEQLKDLLREKAFDDDGTGAAFREGFWLSALAKFSEFEKVVEVALRQGKE